MVNTTLPLPPPPPFIPVPRHIPASPSPSTGYTMSPEELKKLLDELREKQLKRCRDEVTSYLEKKMEKIMSLKDD